MNVQLSKTEQAKIKQSYNSQYSDDFIRGVPSPIIQKTTTDIFNEEHSFKLTHVLIIAGITWILLRNHQDTEPPLSDFVVSA